MRSGAVLELLRVSTSLRRHAIEKYDSHRNRDRRSSIDTISC